MKEVYIQKWESGFWWIVDKKTLDGIDGFKFKYQAINYLKNSSNLKLVKRC